MHGETVKHPHLFVCLFGIAFLKQWTVLWDGFVSSDVGVGKQAENRI
jgi:hypothetical protein